ncbi:MAG: hypothetical protein J6B79_00210 [Clostridia bacterium]|nr:hypothetical protein [Clostridia bacterium]
MAQSSEVRAKKAYETFCAYFDGRNLKYDKESSEDGAYRINISGKGDDLTMKFLIVINPKYDLISILSQMPFNIDEDKLAYGAIATSIITDNLREGSFDFNVKTGAIYYRITSSYSQMEVTKELCAHLFEISTYTVDRYNDKLFMFAKGAMSTEEIYDFVHSDK